MDRPTPPSPALRMSLSRPGGDDGAGTAPSSAGGVIGCPAGVTPQ